MNSATSSKEPRYSVVIVTYNSRENIQVCLDSLQRCAKSAATAGMAPGSGTPSGGLEIIVVDNNSRDGTQAYLSSRKDIRTILNDGNNGFSKGCNQGAESAKGQYVIFLNPDTLVTPGWADHMARYFQDPLVGAVGPVSNYVAGLQRLDMNLPPKWKDAQKFPGNGPVEIADNVAGILKEANAGRGVITKILIGFCLMMPRSLYNFMGGMDENLFLGNDDLDLSWRLRNIGRKLVVASDAFVFHEGQKSFQTEAKSHVDRLTQESTDALYVKLVKHYGGADRVPSATELWGIGWFSPSPSLIKEMQENTKMQAKSRKMELQVKPETRETTAWKGISALIYLGPDNDPDEAENPDGPRNLVARLERSLATLPSRPGPDILILNCSGRAASVETPAGATLRKLDLGSACTPKQALEIAVNLLPGSHALFCMAGVEFSTLFNHWLDKREPLTLGSALPLPIRIMSGKINDGPGSANRMSDMDSTTESGSALAFLCRKDWLRTILLTTMETLDTEEFLAHMAEKLRETRESECRDSEGEAKVKPIDPPWLLVNRRDLPGMEVSQSESLHDGWTPVAPAKPDSPAMQASAPALPKTNPQSQGNLMEALKNLIGNSTEDRTPQRAPTSNPPATPQKGGDVIGLYPESLRSYLRGAKDVAFAGTAAEKPVLQGGFKVYDSVGALVPLAAQDLVILRVTPDLIEGLAARIRNIKIQAAGLKRLIVVCNGNQALGLKASQKSPLTPVDLNPEGIRAALLHAGFTVTAVQPYRGFPGLTEAGANLEGWSQVEAVPRDTAYAVHKLVSIVILGFNQVEYTKKCIESIRKYTRQKYELILVDNGSKDGTEAYFRSIPGAKVIHNPVNLGVAKGWNQGMRIATGEYILILNNDIIVGPDWLENMVRLAETDPSIGLVGPRSNYIAGPQIVPDVPYKAEGEIQGFIGKWQADHALSAADFGFIKGFCHLIPRQVFAKVGFYDERFGKGNFEDDDYCMRVHYHGFRALMADDTFIHHYGSVSFNQESVDWRALMIENQKKYTEKWAKGPSAIHDTVVHDNPPAVSTPVASMPAASAPVVSAPAVAASVPNSSTTGSVSRLMAERLLGDGRRAYESGDVPRARALFLDAQAKDPMNAEVYGNLGVVQYHLSSLQDASTLFMKCLELDPVNLDAAQNLLEVIIDGNGDVSQADLRTLAARFPANPIIAAIAAGHLHAPAAETADAETEADLPAPLPAWRTELEALIGKSAFTPALDLLDSKLRQNVEPGACYNYLGIIAHACGDKTLALQHFTTATKHAPADSDIVYNLADTWVALGRTDEAARYLRARATASEDDHALDQIDFGASAEQLTHALATGKTDAERIIVSRDANQKGERLLRSGKTEAAKEFFRSALKDDGQDFRAHNNLGLAAWYQGRGEEAWKHFRDCLAIRPAWKDALLNAFDTALALNRIEAMQPLLDRALAESPNHSEAAAMRAHILSDGPAIYSGKNFEGLQECALACKRAEQAMKDNRKSDAIQIFMDALETRPTNPQAMNGLGIIAFGEKRYTDAYGLFEAAAAMHPMDQDILMNLWQCAQALRREVEVLPKLKFSLERNPALEDIKAVVREYA